ncbi:hypothetical protein Tco_1142520 [Tanacetum coccineum]
MIASMLSPSDSICSGGSGTDGSIDGGSGLDLLRDEDGNSDESSGCRIGYDDKWSKYSGTWCSSRKKKNVRQGVVMVL